MQIETHLKGSACVRASTEPKLQFDMDISRLHYSASEGNFIVTVTKAGGLSEAA